MRLIVIIFSFCLFVTGCGVKEEPKYQSQSKYIEKIKVI
tara:strand:- start:16 stop:132 length:117 start_codon:yes stop_codon:yes gene_type:complete